MDINAFCTGEKVGVLWNREGSFIINIRGWPARKNQSSQMDVAIELAR